MNRNSAFHRQDAVALVLVLGSLCIVSALIIAFFASVMTERAATHSYAVNIESRKLAHEAMHIVVAQIGEATNPYSPDGTTETQRAWISQPGLIRTFDTTGNPVTAYKLYSASSMRETGAFDPANSADSSPSNWASSPGLYTDLNAPVLVSDSNGAATVGSEKYNPVYPIVDPTAGFDAANNASGVHGFSISNAPVDASAAFPNPAPMPTRWLYVLRDGAIAAGADNGSAVTVNGATKANPIVGRVAFWTDDDTCKVNINTAAGDLWDSQDPGSFMDMPHANTTYETKLASYQPVNHEFQRYPGHPATTYLSAVFPFLGQQDLASIAPRIVFGGSKGGTAASTTALVSDKDRLYASTDELLYSGTTFSASAPLARKTNLETTGNAAFTAEVIAKDGFFVTAHSRAPEVNLFNRPRVTIWPEAAAAGDSDGSAALYGTRTTFDKTIAFCSTVGGKPFYFVRNNCTSPTEDYLDYPRNRQLYRYLQNLTGDAAYAAAIPGFGGNFKSKYGDDRDQILTEIFDYIRCTDLADSNLPVASRYAIGPSTPVAISSAPSGMGQVVPIEIADPTKTRGFGRMPTAYSPTLFFYATAGTPTTNHGTVTGIQALFFVEFFTAAHGVMRLKPNIVVEVEGLDQFYLEGKPLQFPHIARVDYTNISPYHDYGWGSLEGAANAFAGYSAAKPLGQNYPTEYPFFSDTIAVNKAVAATWDGAVTSTVNLTSSGSGAITVRIYGRDKSNTPLANPLQTLTFVFPQPINIPTPRIYAGTAAASFMSRMGPGYNTAGMTDWRDATRAVEPTTGDARIIAALKDVPAGAFCPHQDYHTPTARFAHSMRSGNGRILTGSGNCAGKLVKDAAYFYNSSNGATYFPAVPYGINGVMLADTGGGNSPGDWDTGMGKTPDGPYINKPDEGETGTSGDVAYFTQNSTPVKASLFAPNRQVPSPVIFGSLSTGIKASEAAFAANDLSKAKPWQTLLFCPNPPAKGKHPGKASPPDHLLLDLFTMPVVEPYPISEPFSTAGKINLNYQIVPFTYLTRNTGMQAVLKSAKITAIPTSDAAVYKSGGGSSVYRLAVDPGETLKAFDARFAANKPFLSASEICDMFLVPDGVTYSGATDMANWWDNYALTGDNLREKPYSDIYPRLTTKSNTFTVHVRAQSLKKRVNSPPDQWTEGKDGVTSEYRGSFTIERYLNPGLAAYDETQPLSDYKFRVVETRQFAP
ncbi:MAG: Verru_Chthon cassette protein A [Chthoniobacteraceae bacterium]|nr:Verru_Chthon cassette protein A [Chthoniobacteraceae bacterium]